MVGEPLTRVGANPGVGQYAVNTATGVYTFSATDAGRLVSINYKYQVWAPGKHPDQALPYNGIAYVASANYQLNDNAELPNHSFEVRGRLRYDLGSGALNDANPKDIIVDFLTNPNYGVGFLASRIGDLSQYSNYCVANNLLLSPVFNDQKEAREHLTELAGITNSEFIWSAGVLKVLPYGDQAATGNGATFQPDLTPIYDLADDDYLSDEGEEPVRCVRSSPADAYNHIQVEIVSRANQYNVEIAEAKDQALIDTFGLRSDSPLKAHAITTPATGRLVAQLRLQRHYVRNVYEFKLGWKYCLLEPMDLVTITDSGLGLDRQLARVVEIEEDETGRLSVKVEEVLVGASSSAVYGTQAGVGYQPNYNVLPGPVNAPILFDAPVEIADTGLEVWTAVSGGPNWGGCEVWISTDGNTYRRTGRIHGGARMGIISSTLPIGSDPDLVNVLPVDLSLSRGDLLTGTKIDADLFHTLCWVDGEFIAYETATLTAANRYSLAYLRRGAYGSSITNHAASVPFARIDQAVFAYPYTKDQIGKTIYIKFLSFNIYGGTQQDLSEAVAYSYQIKGPPLPGNVTGFGAQQNGNVVVFKWAAVTSFALKGYDVRYGTQGTTDWNAMIPLTEAARGTEMTNAAVPPGSWTFAIRARDVADQLSPQMARTDLNVVNAQMVIAARPQAPDWLGPTFPTLDLNAATAPDDGMAPLGSFVRAGATATRINNRGYIETVAANWLRLDHDLATLTRKGWLIEDIRTNSIIYSNDIDNLAWTKRGSVTVTADNMVSPSGSLTADKINNLGGLFSNDLWQYSGVPTGVRYDPSFWILKGSASGILRIVNPSNNQYGSWSIALSSIGSGWERITRNHVSVIIDTEFLGYNGTGGIHFTIISGTASFNIWNAQCEISSFSRSSISTISTTVTCNPDDWSIPVSSFAFNPSEGLLCIAAYAASGAAGAQTLIQIDDGTNINRIAIIRDGNRRVRCLVVSGNMTQANLDLGTATDADFLRVAFSWQGGALTGSLNGGEAVGATAGSMPSGLQTLRMGRDAAGNYWNGHIQRVQYWRRPTSSAQTVSLSANGRNPFGFARHWGGVLVPAGTKRCSQYGWEALDQFVPDPVGQAIYEAPEIDTQYDDQLRIWGTISALLGPGVTGSPSAGLQIDTRLIAGAYSGTFQPWTVGTVAARFVRARLALDTADGVACVKAFTPTIDTPEKADGGTNVVVPPTGKLVSFTKVFHFAPNVQVTALGGTAVIGQASNVTTFECTLWVFDRVSGAAITGTVNWQAMGS